MASTTWPKTGPDGLAYWEKDPSASKDYSVDWTEWLAGAAIVTSTWVVEAGLTGADDWKDASSATIQLSAGTHGVTYRVTNTIIDNSAVPRTESKSFNIVVKNQ